MIRTILSAFILLSVVLLAAGCGGNASSEAKQSEATASPPVQEGDVKRPQVAVSLTDGFQDAEAYMPIGYLQNKGIDVTVIGPKTGSAKAYNSDFEIEVQKSISEVNVDQFDTLVLPVFSKAIAEAVKKSI